MSETKTEWIQEVNPPGNQVKIGDKWHDVEGKAQQYLNRLKASCKAEIGRNQKGNIIYIKNMFTESGVKAPAGKDERITRMAMMNTASKIMEPFQAPNPNERASMIIELAKRLQVYVDTGENPFDTTPQSEKVR